MSTLPPDITSLGTTALVELEATGQFALAEQWGDALFYGDSSAPPGGVGAPALRLRGTAPLRFDVFHRPPPAGEGAYGATDMTNERLWWRDQHVVYDPRLVAPLAAERVAAIVAIAPPGSRAPQPTVLLIAARARLVATSTVNTSLPPSLFGSRRQKHFLVEIRDLFDVRPLWVAL